MQCQPLLVVYSQCISTLTEASTGVLKLLLLAEHVYVACRSPRSSRLTVSRLSLLKGSRVLLVSLDSSRLVSLHHRTAGGG